MYVMHCTCLRWCLYVHLGGVIFYLLRVSPCIRPTAMAVPLLGHLALVKGDAVMQKNGSVEKSLDPHVVNCIDFMMFCDWLIDFNFQC